MNSKYKLLLFDLLIFDVDGTIAPRYEPQLYPQAAEFFQLWGAARADDRSVPAIALATNQGGPAMRYWMESEGFGDPSSYPTLAQVQARLNIVVAQIPPPARLYVAYAYQSSKGVWSPTPPEWAGDPAWSRQWRKPNPGMLLQAAKDHGVGETAVLMIGDTRDDEGAAIAAGVGFCPVPTFWEHAKELLDTWS